MAGNDDERTDHRAGDRVGLGRVVHDDTAKSSGRTEPDEVEEASSESFPASDPPAYAPRRQAPADAEPERPDPRDVP